MLKYEFVKNYIEIDSNIGYKLISNDYEHSKKEMEIKCNKGHIYKASYSSFQQGHRCTECEKENKKLRQTHTYEYVKNYVANNTNFKLISKIYINNGENLEFKCTEGHSFQRTFGNLLSEKECPICRMLNNKGENHHSWNPNLSQEDRELGRNIEGYSDWIYSVQNRDKYICQCCGKHISGDANTHHLDGYNWCKDKGLDVSNGVTLCKSCHTSFHKDYGYGDNTEEQFIFWILQNGINIFNINIAKKESVLINRPIKKIPMTDEEIKKYNSDYYKSNSRKYSEKQLDDIFYEVILENTDDYCLTTKGFEDITGINTIAFTKVFKMNWIRLLEKYNKLEQLYKYIIEEYEKFYLETYRCDLYKFTTSHEYITQHLLSLIDMPKIKLDCGFKTNQRHNLNGLIKNLDELILKYNRIPFYNEFIKDTKISIKSYLIYFDMEAQDYNKVVTTIIKDKKLLDIYFEDCKNRTIKNASIGGIIRGEKKGYSDEEKEIEFRKIFDNFFLDNNKYPTKKQFNELSKYNDNTYRKKYKITWNETKTRYNYPI